MEKNLYIRGYIFRKMKKILLFVLAGFLMCSCGSYKRLAYLQDMEPGVAYDVSQSPETRIGRDDVLGIMVYSSQPELAAPFNVLPATVSEGIKKEGSTEAYSAEVGVEYRVDTVGCINFPVLGMVYVEGMTLDEIMMSLAEQIKATGYVKDPIVKAEYKNFQVTVLGETGKQIVNIPTGNMNIFDLLATTGDLTEDAERTNVWVIRTVGDTRKVYSLNLKTKAVFDSPAFYLQQKDLVYAVPKRSKIDKKMTDVMTVINWPLMILTTVSSTAALIIALTRL